MEKWKTHFFSIELIKRSTDLLEVGGKELAILNKLTDYEIVRKILDYRTYTKLYSNYIVGLIEYIIIC